MQLGSLTATHRWLRSIRMRMPPWLLLLAVVATGCTTRQQTAGSWLDRFRALRHGFHSDAVPIEVSILRQQMGDPYLNHELWDMVDEQALPLDQKPVLAANGFRVGMVGGTLPAELQTLLTAEPKDAEIRRATKTDQVALGASARRLTIKAGQAFFLALGPAERSARLQVSNNGQATRFELEKAQFGLFIQPSLSENGEAVLRFEPAARHGESRLMPRPNEDKTDWTLLANKPEERFPGLGWEMKLPPNEYVIVGGLVQQPGTLGYYSFVQDDMEHPAQWLLVIRSTRTQPSQLSAHHYSPAEPEAQGVKKRAALPLALQSMLPKGQPTQPKKTELRIRAGSP